MSAARLALLQLCDSLFPLGAFAHSDGLESAVAAGQVAGTGDLRAWLHAVLDGVLARCDAPAVRDAMAATAAGDVAALDDLNVDLDAMRPSCAARDASRAMGRRLLQTWQQVRPGDAVAVPNTRRVPCTFPVAFGMVCSASGVTVPDALEGYCYVRLAGCVSAAMRLMTIGQVEAHTALAAVLLEVPGVAAGVMADTAPPRSFVPLMDIAAMRHQHVHSRLFRS